MVFKKTPLTAEQQTTSEAWDKVYDAIKDIPLKDAVVILSALLHQALE